MKRILVNRERILENRKTGRRDPVLVIFDDNDPLPQTAHLIEGNGPFRFVYSPDAPLHEGSELWFETDAGLEIK